MVPWISWTQPFAEEIGWAEHLLDIARIVMDLSAVVFVLGYVGFQPSPILAPGQAERGAHLAGVCAGG